MNTSELLHDLAEALDSPEGQADPAGMLAAWAALVRGDVTPEDCYRPATPGDRLPNGANQRQAWALTELQRGPLVAGAIVRRFGVTGECARRDLARLVEAGLAERHGERRGTYYVAGAGGAGQSERLGL